MIVLTGNSSRPKGERYFADRENLGQLLGPCAWRTPWTQHWACDNDVFANRDDAGWWKREGETRWLKMLDKAAAQKTRPMFCVLPDVVGDWAETIYRAWYYLPELRDRNLPVALALQNGPIEQVLASATMLYPDFFFIGGSTEWKWTNAQRISEYAHAIGRKCHVGRASGPRRIRECLRIGVDSCDGSQWLTFADKMMPVLFDALDNPLAQPSQLTLFIRRKVVAV